MKYLLEGQETKRLTMRPLEAGDFKNWLKLFEYENAAQFLGMAHLPTAEEQCRYWFDLQEKRYANDMGGMNVLINKETRKLVGQCGLLIQEVDGQTEMEIGYSVLPEFWRLGYATEAAQKCRDYAFENAFTDSIISIIHVDNLSSEKVAQKNGMKKRFQTVYKNMPVNVYRIYINEWLAMQTK